MTDDTNLLNLEDAAKYVGKSSRTLQRLRDAKKLTGVMLKIPGERNKILHFRKDELVELKASFERPMIQPTIARPDKTDENVALSFQPKAVAVNDKTDDTTNENVVLPLQPNANEFFERLTNALETIANNSQLVKSEDKLSAKEDVLSLTDLNQKFVLTMKEAVRLSGLSDGLLRRGIQEKRLRVVKDGAQHGYRILRTDLIAFAQSLYDEK